jgi:hypothetical protein
MNSVESIALWDVLVMSSVHEFSSERNRFLGIGISAMSAALCLLTTFNSFNLSYVLLAI